MRISSQTLLGDKFGDSGLEALWISLISSVKIVEGRKREKGGGALEIKMLLQIKDFFHYLRLTRFNIKWLMNQRENCVDKILDHPLSSINVAKLQFYFLIVPPWCIRTLVNILIYMPKKKNLTKRLSRIALHVHIKGGEKSWEYIPKFLGGDSKEIASSSLESSIRREAKFKRASTLFSSRCRAEPYPLLALKWTLFLRMKLSVKKELAKEMITITSSGHIYDYHHHKTHSSNTHKVPTCKKKHRFHCCLVQLLCS